MSAAAALARAAVSSPLLPSFSMPAAIFGGCVASSTPVLPSFSLKLDGIEFMSQLLAPCAKLLCVIAASNGTARPVAVIFVIVASPPWTVVQSSLQFAC